MRRWLAVGFLFLTLTPAHASHGLLSWRFPRSHSPQPTSFTLTYTHGTTPTAGLHQMTVPPSAPGACETEPADDDTYCALWPACPAAGDVLLFWVQAVWPEGLISAQSNTLLCQFTAAQPCVCLDPGQDVPPPPAVAVPHPPDGAAALASILSLVPLAPV
jgi:hypothetical protein